MPKPNPNRTRSQPTPDSPPPADQGKRDAPGDQTDWIEVGHEEAEAQRRDGDAVPASHGNSPSAANPPHTER